MEEEWAGGGNAVCERSQPGGTGPLRIAAGRKVPFCYLCIAAAVFSSRISLWSCSDDDH
jgi:hypothetical protein